VRSGHQWGWKVWVGSLPTGTQRRNVAEQLADGGLPAPLDINVQAPTNRSGSAYAVITCRTEKALRDVAETLQSLRFPRPANAQQDWHDRPLIRYLAGDE
jgi:hypothetical protein